MNVADAVRGTDHGLAVEGIGGAEARGEIVAIRMDQGAVVDGSVFGVDKRIVRRVEVGEAVLRFILRSGKLIAQAGIEGQARGHFPIVLNVAEMHSLAVFDDQRVGDTVGAARSEQEVGDVVVAARSSAGGTAELAGVVVLAVFGVEVFNVRVDGLVFVSEFQAVTPLDKRIVQTRVDDQRVLMLRIAVLPAHTGEAADILRVEAAAHPRAVRDSGDSVSGQHSGSAKFDRGLAGFGAGNAEPEFR